MKKKDIILILVLIIVAFAALLLGLSLRRPVQEPAEAATSESEEEGKAQEGVAAAPESEPVKQYSEEVLSAAEAYFAENRAESYLLVRNSQSSSPPIPLNEEYSFTVRQRDGSENTIHVGVNSFYMESSNCDNQNCVEEGIVTLDNMKDRVLFNLVICLPHQLTLEMLTPSEAETALLEMLSQQEMLRSIETPVPDEKSVPQESGDLLAEETAR